MAMPDYFAHDARYRQLRAEGASGWDPDEVSAERERELEWAMTAMGPVVGKRMLELGCGAGNHVAWFVERGYDYGGRHFTDRHRVGEGTRGHRRAVHRGRPDRGPRR
jgi:hypothetical protein